MAIQDTRKVTSVEAFKNRQYRYQLTEYEVEIERMTVRLEHLYVEGASQEPALLERMEIEVKKMICFCSSIQVEWKSKTADRK